MEGRVYKSVEELVPEEILFVRNDKDLQEGLRVIKSYPGDVIYVSSFFGTATYPDEMIRWRAQQLFSTSDDIEKYITLIKEEKRVMAEKLRKYKVVCLRHQLFIKNYITGKEPGIIKDAFISSQLRKQHIQKVIEMLEKWNNFEIGLTKEPLNFEFMVCEVAAVWGTRYANEPGIRAVFFTSREVINGFKKEFEEMWSRALTQKREIIKAFQKALSTL